jgi:prevent-host-death family protein
MSKTVAAAEFQAHSLELLEEVAAKQEELVVVENGKPLVKVVPIAPQEQEHPPRRPPRTLEELRGSVETLGDIVEPLDVEWDAMK